MAAITGLYSRYTDGWTIVLERFGGDVSASLKALIFISVILGVGIGCVWMGVAGLYWSAVGYAYDVSDDGEPEWDNGLRVMVAIGSALFLALGSFIGYRAGYDLYWITQDSRHQLLDLWNILGVFE